METRELSVGLVQINSGFSGQHYFPYSVGILQAYAQRHLPKPERFKFLLPVYRRIRVAEAVEQLEGADIAAFSAYVWNISLSLAIAKELKSRKPKTLVVFGGPQVPRHDRPWEIEQFFTENPCVDLAVHGAGEKPFAAILEHGVSGNWGEIPSVSFRLGNPLFQTYETETPGLRILPTAGFRQTERASAFKNLAEVPSPYVGGVFDPLMAANPNEKWIGLWESDRNCPFSCTFCGWGLLESKPAFWPIEHVFRDVDWFAEHKLVFVFCANANFFLTDRDLDIARYVAETKSRKGYPQKLSVQDAKNAANRVFEGRMIMERADLNTGVVISLQSVDPTTLKIVRRSNIKLGSYRDLQHRFRAKGIETMTDMILPLAGQTYASFADGVSEVIDYGQHNRIQFNLCCSVPDAEMSHRDEMAKYGLETVTTKMVNIHGQVESEEVPEYQDLVIATEAMSREDWVRARVFSWMVQLLYFDKLLQIPIVLGRTLGSVTYREIFEFFSEGRFGSGAEFPILGGIREFFREKAKDIQQGGTEYVHSKEWLDIYWPADEFIFIELAVQGKLEKFYLEAERALCLFLKERGTPIPDLALRDAFRLNLGLVKQPFQEHDLTVSLSHNVWEFYRAVILGREAPLEAGDFQYRINRTAEKWNAWEDWYREVVWYGNKRGAYLYGNTPVTQLSGHY